MARVRISSFEAARRDLPMVCMQCGAGATARRPKRFAWNPSWAYILLLLGLLPFILAALLTTKRMTLDAPLCREHENHWSWRARFIWVGFLLFAVVGAVALTVYTDRDRDMGDALGGLLCAGPIIVGLAWLIAAAVVQHSSIRPEEITDHDIMLVKVSPEFVEALERKREGEHGDDGPADWSFGRGRS